MSRPTPPSYKTKNWPSYNAALKQRGSLTIWFDPDMVWVGSIDLLSRNEIAAFLESHIALTEITARVGSPPRWVEPKLAADDFVPVNDANRIGSTFDRRRDVAAVLQPRARPINQPGKEPTQWHFFHVRAAEFGGRTRRRAEF